MIESEAAVREDSLPFTKNLLKNKDMSEDCVKDDFLLTPVGQQQKLFEIQQRKAQMYSTSTIVPDAYKNNVGNCYIAVDMATRMRANELVIMQNLDIIKGKSCFSAKFLIGVINMMGNFSKMKFRTEKKGFVGKIPYKDLQWDSIAKKNKQIIREFDGTAIEDEVCIAYATDLESGARVVLQKGVTLSQAMRASMSVPGAYAPVEYGGRLLVDGGLVDNLPVGQARSMGAEVVVAINVGTPLSKRKSLDSVVGIMGQVVNLLTEQNVQASLKELQQTDIYIAPDLSGFNSGDFMRSAEIIERGYQAAIARKKDLEVFSVSQEQYRAWQQARAKEMRRVHSHKLSGVRIDGLKVVNAKRVLSDIDINAQGEVQNEEVAEAAREIWATGDFQRVPFRFEPGPYNTEVLVFEPQEKDYGYSVLRFGGNLQSNFQEANTFNVILSHSWSWLNSWEL